MSRGELSSPVEVRVGACLCEGTPHPDGDVVFLAAKLPAPAGHAAVRALAEGGDLNVTITAAIVRHAIVEWNFTDHKGADVPVNPGNVDRYLPWNEGGKQVAAKAFQIYLEGEGNGPFSSSTSRRTSKNSSPPTPIAGQTSRTRRSSSKRPSSSESPSEPVSAGPQSAASP